ncbi:MAG: nitroreductase family protein [Mycobacteriales bacterium]
MEFADVVRRRRMVRAYDPHRPVPPAPTRRLLEHAVRAPSAGFSQGWDFLVLRSAADREAFWAATAEVEPDGDEADPWLRGLATAPLLIVCLSNRDAYLDRYAAPDKGWIDRDEARWPVPYWDVDTGMAALLMLLTAVDEGLAGCFFGVPPDRHDALRSAFDIPASRMPVGVVSVGYAAPDRRSPSLKRGRRPVSDVAHDGRFGRPFALGE